MRTFLKSYYFKLFYKKISKKFNHRSIVWLNLSEKMKIVKKDVSPRQQNALANGVITLKGGDVQAETYPFRNIVEVMDIDNWFEEEWFREKHLIYVPC